MKPGVIIGGVVVIAAIAGGGYFFLKKNGGGLIAPHAAAIAPDGTAAGETTRDQLGSDGGIVDDASDAQDSIDDDSGTSDDAGDNSGAIQDGAPPSDDATGTTSGDGDVFGDSESGDIHDAAPVDTTSKPGTAKPNRAP